ncbi:hypothetical protein OHT76_05565 [Streptomyces sp. NBC_00287]|uniref:hypothetical protein n=1 Tax=Streptomyces sp. NBC_00287 TaxID=2975702 RepID=UPI002E2949D3|nr:hypothetical protein [Streptomyces sp. NBC_00287]
MDQYLIVPVVNGNLSIVDGGEDQTRSAEGIMKLVSCATGQEIAPGSTLRMESGRFVGIAWRFERIVERPDGSCLVHVTRLSAKLGRISQQYHPGAFGCEITTEIAWRQNIRAAVHHAWTKADDYLLAGVFALVPLAFFEQYHLGEAITSALGLGGH